MKITKYAVTLALCGLVSVLGCRSTPKLGPLYGTACGEGQTIAISLNWQAMMAQAPVLDPIDPAFDRNKALFWQKIMRQTCLSAISQSSELFRGGCEVVFGKDPKAVLSPGPEGISKMENGVAALPTENDADIFVKEYLRNYLQGAQELAIAIQYLKQFLATIDERSAATLYISGSISLSERELALFDTPECGTLKAHLCEKETVVRKLIYSPVLFGRETRAREGGWNMLKRAVKALHVPT